MCLHSVILYPVKVCEGCTCTNGVRGGERLAQLFLGETDDGAETVSAGGH